MYFPTTRLVSGPDAEPLDLEDDAKAHLRVTHSDDDDYIGTLITAARSWIELVCNRALVTQEWKVFFDYFPCGQILLPHGKLQTISEFKWTDTAGTAHTWTVSGGNLMSGSIAMAHIDADREPAALVLAYGQSWPTESLKTSNPIEITFECGYGDDGTDVPQPLRSAMLLLIGHWYRNREAVVITDRASVESRVMPLAVDALIANYRLHYV